jgi:hypothetical protein
MPETSEQPTTEIRLHNGMEYRIAPPEVEREYPDMGTVDAPRTATARPIAPYYVAPESPHRLTDPPARCNNPAAPPPSAPSACSPASPGEGTPRRHGLPFGFGVTTGVSSALPHSAQLR